MFILLLLVVLPLFNTITSNINTTTVTTITTMPKGMQVKFSRNYEGSDNGSQYAVYEGCQKGITAIF
jgi:hypothetical protein